jgi:hypothetical protein
MGATLGPGVDANLEALLGTLLYEGYALYPYTASAVKNATPTPFGIVYPPSYAAGPSAAFDRLRLHGVVRGDSGARLGAEVRFLQAAAEGGHRAVERRLAVPEASLARLADDPYTECFEFGHLTGRLRLSAEPRGQGLWRIALCVHNTTPLEPGAERAEALHSSLLSTHPLLRLSGGSFASPLERAGEAGRAVEECASVNTFPVLATPGDDVLLGAAIVLPDHPVLAPESRGDLFDGTEIEEALVLHVLALSDDERAEIAAADPAIHELIARAAAATPADLIRLHGRTTLSEPAETR